MNKIPLTIQSVENPLQHPGVNDMRTSLARLSKNIKSNEFKSPSKLGSTSSTARNLHLSPSEHFSKGGYALKNAKSPVRRPKHAILSIDDYESKENCSFEAKAPSVIKLESKKNTSTLNTNRSIAATTSTTANKSNASSQVQTQRNRSPIFDAYDIFSSKKSSKIEGQPSGSLLLNQKDVKPSFSIETSKGNNMPASLKLTLDKICKKEGSSTHRVSLNSPTSEVSLNSVKIIKNLQKSSKDLGIDAKARVSSTEKTAKSSNAKHKLNTMLVELTKPSVSQGKKSSRQSIRNVNSVNITPRQDYSGVYSIDEENEIAKKYKKLLGLLKEKDKKIEKLSHDKSELQSSLYMLEGELKSVRREKGKEDSLLSDLQDGLHLEQSRNQSYRNVEKSHIHSPSPLHSTYMCQKSVIDLSSGDIKPPKQPSTNLIGVFGKSPQRVSDRSGKTWNTSIDHKMLNDRKRYGNRDSSLEYPQPAAKSSSYIRLEPNRQETSFRQRNEHGSQKEKLSYLKEIDEDFEEHHNKQKQNINVFYLPENIVFQSPAINPKKARKAHNDRENTSVDRAVLRNTSVESGLRSQSQLHERQIGLNSSLGCFTSRNVSQENHGEGLNIGGALNDLKDRIKKLLIKRDEGDHTKTQMLCEALYDRLQKVV